MPGFRSGEHPPNGVVLTLQQLYKAPGRVIEE
jgi:hypothetical protein